MDSGFRPCGRPRNDCNSEFGTAQKKPAGVWRCGTAGRSKPNSADLLMLRRKFAPSRLDRLFSCAGFAQDFAAAPWPHSLIPCSNSAHSLIFAIYLPVTANSFPGSAAQGISPQALESAGAASRRRTVVCKTSLLFWLYLQIAKRFQWCRKRDSNPRPHHYECHLDLFEPLSDCSPGHDNTLPQLDLFDRRFAQSFPMVRGDLLPFASPVLPRCRPASPGKQNPGNAMTKLTKRQIDALKSRPDCDVFAWDGELRGFGVRVKPSGLKTYLVQYRNAEGRTRRLVLGQHGVFAPEQARDLARQKLAAAARGEDPSAQRHAARAGMTVAEICDWYLEQARAARILGRNRRPIKESTLECDQGRIEKHIKPLLGSRSVRSLELADIENMQADIASGKTARGRKGRGGRTTGGAGSASRTVATLRALLGHACRVKLIEANPAHGVRQIASKRRDRHLGVEELQALGRVMRACSDEGEHPKGLAAMRFILLTGFRRLEALALQHDWVSNVERCVNFPDTKSGAQIRPIGKAAIELIAVQPTTENSPYVFPADVGDGHFIGLVRVLKRVCDRAEIPGITPHVLRHSFATIAAELGFSELTIAGLLGHASQGVTQRYVHLDKALVLAANQVSAKIAELLDVGDVACCPLSEAAE
jgi:integrase